MKKLIPFFCALLLLTSCNIDKSGSVKLSFNHQINSQEITLNQMIYTNAAGNDYQINEIKYFISKVYFIKSDESLVEIANAENVHYTDLNYPSTLSWTLEGIERGDYIGMTFIFGLDEEDNVSNRFVNAPESNFSWPDVLGGGYHYMQINGKYKDSEGQIQAMNFHSGIGQLYTGNTTNVEDIYEFVHNYINITIPAKFSVKKGEETPLTLSMNVESWFNTPYIYDHNVFGSSIMQNQNAQLTIKANGIDVFTLIP